MDRALGGQRHDRRKRLLELVITPVLIGAAAPVMAVTAAAVAITSGRGADIALDVGGPGTFDQSVAALRFEGNLILIGTLTGFGGAIDTLAMIRKATRVSGVYIGPRRMLETLAHATHSSRMHPIIDEVYDFTEASQAYERLGSGEHFGKVVIAIR